jgi:deoxyribonuclease V
MGEPGWADAEGLRAEQDRVARLAPPAWRPPPPGALTAVGCFVAYRPGEEGPGRAGDRGWVGVATWSEKRGAGSAVAVPGVTAAAYHPGLLALREGDMLLAAIRPVLPEPRTALLVDATGRDHPRRAGLALHLGHLLDTPTVGITHRPLHGDRAMPDLTERGRFEPILLGDEPVAAWVCTASGVRPVVAHAGWRTDVDTAVEVALRTSAGARTPEPLRLARQAARNARHAEVTARSGRSGQESGGAGVEGSGAWSLHPPSR